MKPTSKKKVKTNNPKGRPRGVPNKITREVKENAKNLVNFCFEILQERRLTNAQLIEIMRINLPFTCTKEEKITVDGNISALDALKKQLFGDA